MLFTFDLTLPAQAAPVRIHLGGIPEGLTLGETGNHMAVQQVDRNVEDVDVPALLVRGGRVVQLADH